ncbi:MAG: PLP-dependent aminotransferase family protein [Chitinophagaceae bacterium]
MQALRDAIRRGVLRPAEPLPSTRLLARSLNVARGTVVEAFEQLVAEGFLESRGRGTTRVAAAPTRPREESRRVRSGPKQKLSAAASHYAKVAEEFRSLRGVPFAISVPTGAVAPSDVWRRLGNRLRARGPASPAGYSDPQGALALREAIAEYVRRSRSVRCEARHVVVTTGTQQALYLACRVLFDSDDTCWVENPAYRGITAILESLERADRMVRVTVDPEGLDVASGLKSDPNARAAFVTPSHQYPLGMPLSMRRREALLSWARDHGSWIVEDDYDSELRYAGHPFPALQGLDPDRVIYIGTFSKILFPSLRLGYAVLPEDLVPAFCGARILLDRHPPGGDQHVLAAFISEGHLERHIRRIRVVYDQQRRDLLALIEKLIPKHLAWPHPSDQGMHLVLWLAPGIDDRLVVTRAAEAGVSLRAVSPMYASGTARPGVVLGFGGFTLDQIRSALRRLAKVIEFSSE